MYSMNLWLSTIINTASRDNSVNDALRRTRAGGAVVSAKCQNAPHTCSITPSFGRPLATPVRTQHRAFTRNWKVIG